MPPTVKVPVEEPEITFLAEGKEEEEIIVQASIVVKEPVTTTSSVFVPPSDQPPVTGLEDRAIPKLPSVYPQLDDADKWTSDTDQLCNQLFDAFDEKDVQLDKIVPLMATANATTRLQVLHRFDKLFDTDLYLTVRNKVNHEQAYVHLALLVLPPPGGSLHSFCSTQTKDFQRLDFQRLRPLEHPRRTDPARTFYFVGRVQKADHQRSLYQRFQRMLAG